MSVLSRVIDPSRLEPAVPRNGQVRYPTLPESLPDIANIVIEDGAPVDGVTTEKHMRLLTEPLYTSWPGPGSGRPFAALANVGLFHTEGEPPIVPDVMLSLDVRWPENLRQKRNNTYFVWLIGKMPDVAIEIVSNLEGGEEDRKLREYARLRISYYVIYDPDNLLGGGPLQIFELRGRKYVPLATGWLEDVGLGLRLWEGTFEDLTGTWLRWCDRDGLVIPTGAENSARERQRADKEHARANQEQARADQEHTRAEQERARAEQERARAEQAEKEAALLRAKLKDLGDEPG